MHRLLSPALVPSVSRRAAVRLGTGGIAAALSTRGLPSARAQEAPTTFVLVHGAWAGGWIWRDVVPLLRAAGHTVFATTATGMGDRVHLASPDITLDTHITDVVNALGFEDLHEVVLVGWGYGGMIISGVAHRVPERLARVVYLDADVPVDGENGWDAERYSAAARSADIWSGEDAGIPGFVTVDPYIEWIRASVPDPAIQKWLFAKFVPQPLPTYSQPIRLGLKDLAENPAAAAIPRAFVFCTENKGGADVEHTVRTADRVRSDPGWIYRELADTHFAPVNNALATAEVILSLA